MPNYPLDNIYKRTGPKKGLRLGPPEDQGRAYLAEQRQRVTVQAQLADLCARCPVAPAKALPEPTGFTPQSLLLIGWLIPQLEMSLARHNRETGFLEVILSQWQITAADRRAISTFFRQQRFKVVFRSDSLVALRDDAASWRITVSWET